MVNDYRTTTTPKKLTFWQKQKKRWWLHLINFVVGTILISMLLTYVGMPKIAQHDINDSELFLDYQIVSNPTPNSVDISLRNTIISHSWFTPMLDGFNASLFMEDTEPDIKPFGFIQIPQQHAKKQFKTEITQRLDIVDLDQFISYNKRFTQVEKFRFAMRGRTKMHLGALPVVSVDFNKAIETPGLNGFKGIQISNVNVSMTPFPDGSNMHGTINIPNHSIMTLTIGDMEQDTLVDGEKIGTTTIKNVVLRPGDNFLPMSSTTDQVKVIGLLQKKYKDGVLPIEARTTSITFNGQPLKYFEEAMKTTPVFVSLDLKEPLTRIGLGAMFGAASNGTSSTSSSSSSGSSSSSSSTTTNSHKRRLRRRAVQ